MTSIDPNISLDEPLRPGSALDGDCLARRSFAGAAAGALRKVSSSAGFAVSIEGSWGSGKTSVLAMIEDLLVEQGAATRPIIVHFNPWLIGDRDALLGQFLARIGDAIRLSDHAKDGKKVARELKSYAKAFEVLKLIPGAEPWASIVKSVLESVGEATGAISEHKAPDLEKRKTSVENALRDFPRPVIVFVDDIDRLFPLEVFEMIRIIKAVGGLPHVGYLLAWDPSYVQSALDSLGVPQPEGYLDKIVQVRMPLPSLSASARSRLVNAALADLSADASLPRFSGEADLLPNLYFSGLRELLAQPRDVTRVFNTVRVLEPSLRGELALADIIGLAALMVKAAPVFDLLRRTPAYFVGATPSENVATLDTINRPEAIEARKAAFQACAIEGAARRVTNFLFPLIASSEGGFDPPILSDVGGRLAHPGRPRVALQLSLDPSDVSLKEVRDYVRSSESRKAIEETLSTENCLDFLEQLGDFIELEDNWNEDPQELCLAIALLVDSEPTTSSSAGRDALSASAERLAVRAISYRLASSDHGSRAAMASMLAKHPKALSVAATLIAHSYVYSHDHSTEIPIADPPREESSGRSFCQ